MERDIYVVADSSGSFNECGKNYLQIYLLDAIVNALESQTIKCNTEFRYVLWNTEMSEYTPGSMFKFSGRAELSTLESFISDINDGSLVILLSDGNYDGDTMMLQTLLKMKNIIFIPFAVGADADEISLRVLTDDMTVYSTANLISVIKKIILENV
ncbi:hypothetical protein SAMN02910353_02445 [Ruminococcus sp. YRD2003]|uniref:hypothetical protein n=1 Tax=Ruminococcus sp. YRD2003 TaxID=1452313 RepID=UPI0008C52FAB|nr:hypothetical protein SAMN02910353_02445 [Ruminococcus flavefaciens]